MIGNFSEMTGQHCEKFSHFFSSSLYFFLYNIACIMGKSGLKWQSEKVMRSYRVKHLLYSLANQQTYIQIYTYFTFCECERFGSWPKKKIISNLKLRNYVSTNILTQKRTHQRKKRRKFLPFELREIRVAFVQHFHLIRRDLCSIHWFQWKSINGILMIMGNCQC